MRLEESTEIGAPPSAVFHFFEEMADHYEAWHPDHLGFRWVEGDGLAEGSVAFFEERIGGELQAKRVRFTTVEQDRYIEFEPTSLLTRLFMPHISFTIDPTDDGCTFTQRIRVRTGPIGAWVNRREFDAVRTHMREEGENLRSLLDQSNDATPG